MVDHEKFAKLDVQILGISGMNTFSQKMFAASMDLPYPLLSDYPDLKMIQLYGLLTHVGQARQPVAQGSYLLIDKQGMIRGKWLKPSGEVFPNANLLKAASEIEKPF